MSDMPTSIIPLLEKMEALGASDLHLKTGVPPAFRVAGDLRRTTLPTFEVNHRNIEQLMDPIIPEGRKAIFDQKGQLDFAYHLPNGDRFRINIMRSCEQMHAAIRRVKGEIPGFAELRLPPIYSKLADESFEGLIIVCGVTAAARAQLKRQ